ncbi:MAG: hypothetical protein IKN42_00115 [Elusimicrobia bacterium]|nr:hypothetical protein [Elusimicrobiota bacterium]
MNKTNIQLILTCLLLVLIIYFGFIYKKEPDWNGMPAKNEPIQTEIKNPVPFKNGKFLITPLANYSITGIVISTKRYFFDSVSSISPIDIAIAWKKMSVADVIKEFKFKHRRRAIIYTTKKDYWPIMEKEVKTCISNNHCIPANKDIKKKLLKINKYDLVRIKGQLVKAEKSGMEPWVSSLSRDDGPGWGKLIGCEIIYITDVEILKK